ncbi:Soluble lytic murein transglycosylase and related regulatory protein [alpha proteobacterium BAL199]|jgi:soluble lytic murein transglycosylase|nr:Soluble lytic murein transglycosylase and related regulatory protein [alpha proteobacterium BAL199]
MCALMFVDHSALAQAKVQRPAPRPSLKADIVPDQVAKAPAKAARQTIVPPRPTPRPASAPGRLPPGDSAWRTTLAYAESGDWSLALAVPGRSKDPELSAALSWLNLLDAKRPTDFATVAEFLTQHPNWPGETQLELQAERLMPASLPASTRVVWFQAHRPRTGTARLAYLDALREVGPSDAFVAEIRKAWRELELGEKSQKEFLIRFGNHLRPIDHQERMDEMLWRGLSDDVDRIMPLVSADWRKLATARLRLRYSRAGVDEAVNAVPDSLRNDPGLLYERIRWRRQKGKTTEARELLFDAPRNPEFEALWWRERSWHIREALDQGNPKDAYLLAASHIQRGGIAFAEAEWLAGWLALRFLNHPSDALRHFRTLYENVSTPISRSRAAYWAGRAADALLDQTDARLWYALGAEHATTFYGQLAAARLGATEIALTPTPPVDPRKIKDFRSRSLVKVTEALMRIDRRKLAERFLRTLAFRASDEDESLMITEMAARRGYVSASVYAARRAARSGATLIDLGYPLLNPIPDLPPESALVHAIIRQESGFDVDVVSRAGARGLMQLMPATAKQTARAVGVDYDLGSLVTDPNYNIVLGRAYLSEVIERFGGHYVLAIAAYNAGPHRVDQWIARHGHPASPDVDVIDWIEKIPFSETRNYVQRVLEGLHVYRGKLPQGPTVDALPADSDWRPQAVWCVYSCGVLLDHQQAALTKERKQ